MKTLRIDIETYSDVDLMKYGVYKYTESDAFEILLIGYALDNDPVSILDLTNPYVGTAGFLELLLDPTILKTAYNANFEMTCLSAHFGVKLDPTEWHCTRVQALQAGQPTSLGEVAKALELDDQKDKAGKALINYFCKPCKPTKTNGFRERNMPADAPEKWADFREYCRQDVVVEREIAEKLKAFPLSEYERKLWALDQKINTRGVRIDKALVDKAVECSELNTIKLVERAKEITGLDNPNSVAQLKDWLLAEEGEEVESLNKASVKDLMQLDIGGDTKELLRIRQELGKTSVKKYMTMQGALGSLDRIRGLFEFSGASRTKRWAGRIIQPQNLPQNKLKDLDLARQLVKEGEFEILETMFGNVPDTLSQLIRTALIPSYKCRFIVSDFSAIEARVIAWVSDCAWRQEVFSTHGKIYEASASKMFKMPIAQIGKTSPERQKGKIAELALGYQGGFRAFYAMDKAWAESTPEEELKDLVTAWRDANPEIVAFWRSMEQAAIKAIKGRCRVEVKHGIAFGYERGFLFMFLPSGGRLVYAKAGLEPDDYGRDKIVYYGVSDVKENKGGKKWQKLNTYGGKLAENCVQAIARDCLADAMLRIDAEGYTIVLHVHDEVVLDVPKGRSSVEEIAEIMGRKLPWAEGLILTADGYETEYYRKD